MKLFRKILKFTVGLPILLLVSIVFIGGLGFFFIIDDKDDKVRGIIGILDTLWS